ncbi:MAG: immune inhibitor A [Anaerolinea sp.]|nr:immune inhibitor A [Anaerolinea sp.]
MRKLLAVLVLLLSFGVVSAQDTPPPGEGDYPTVAELANEPIPQRDRLELAERLRGVTDIPAPPTDVPDRQVGDQDTFFVSNSSEGYTREITATLQVVGEHIYLWVENGANVSLRDLEDLADFFDDEVYDQVRELWGSEAQPGIDGEMRVHGLFAYQMGATTAAYVSGDNSYPQEAVGTSNEREMFFFNLDAIGSSFDVFSTGIVVAHEFQHMIRNNLQFNEETWMNEGLSTFTEFYLTGDPDFFAMDFLFTPETQLNSWNEDNYLRSANYGAAQMFLIYFYDHFGIEGMQELSADMSPRALDAVDHVLAANGAANVNEFFADWVVANRVIGYDWDRGYTSLDNFGMSADDQFDFSRYPVTQRSEVNQYGTHYINLPVVSGVKSMEVALEIPEDAQLTAAEIDGLAAYSNRGDVSDTTLTRAFDLTGVSSASLDFRLWYHIEDLWDYGYVMVSEDDGATWDILDSREMTSENPYDTAYGTGYTGISGDDFEARWIDESISLNDYVGENILVRFEYITDDAVNQAGMLIDDVRIDALNYSEDFEGDAEGWEFNGWIRTDNRLPQSAWVQVIEIAGSDVVNVTRWLAEGTESVWTFTPNADADQMILAITPLSPVTTVPMPYTLTIDTK